jgi:hypothetical protein
MQDQAAGLSGEHPASGSRRRWLRWLVICGAAATAIVVVVVVVVVTVAAGPSSSRPQVTQLATPHGPVTLVPGARVTDGVQLGFPHTTVGAISAAADLVSEVSGSLDPSHAEAAMQLLAASSYPTAPYDAAIGAESLRQQLGLAATGPVPPGYAVGITAAEYQVRDVTAKSVMVVLLLKVSFTEPGPKDSQRIGVVPFLMRWERGDWKDAGHTGGQYLQLAVTPFSSRAAALGWKPLRLPV